MTRLENDPQKTPQDASASISVQMESVTLEQIIQLALAHALPVIDDAGRKFDVNLPSSPVWLYADQQALAGLIGDLLATLAHRDQSGMDLHLDAWQAEGRLIVRLGAGTRDLTAARHSSPLRLPEDLESLRARADMLLRFQGGEITAGAEEGKNPFFDISLPVRSEASRPAAPDDLSRADRTAHEGATASRSILIADDNVDAAESLGELLNAFGHEVHVVHDGLSAVAEASRLRPEVVILDISLPNMDGYEVARKLRGDVGLTSSLLLAVTGYAQEKDRQHARQAGFDHHFAKPIDIYQLNAVLDSLDSGSPTAPA